MKEGKEIDMLHGPLLKKIILFALPLAASSLMQQLFNSVDVAIAGHFLGKEALAAVGSNSPVINLSINLFMGISMGANVVISNHIGQNDKAKIHDAINTVALIALVSGLFLCILGVFISESILRAIDTPNNVLPLATTYLRLYFCGIPFFIIFNYASAILRSKGDTKRPLYILLFAGIVNTILNIIFVVCFGLGVEGIAFATCIANIVSAALIVRMLMREDAPYKLYIRHLKINLNELKPMLYIGIPAGLQGMIFSFSNLLMQSAINGYGAAAIAGSAASLNYESYCYFIIAAFNGAAISFIGQNYGAGKNKRVKKIYLVCLAAGFIMCFSLNILILFAHNACLSVFTTDNSVIDFATRRLYIVLATQAIACSYEISGASMRGMGQSIQPTAIVIFGTCILRIIWIFGIAKWMNSFDILMMAYPVSWLVTGFFMLLAYHKTSKRLVVDKI